MSKITFRQLIDTIDKSDANSDSPDMEDLCSALSIQHDWNMEEPVKLKCYHLAYWLCTDSAVGTRAYFLDNEFVAYSNQIGRKYDQEFFFVSNDAAEKVRKYVISLMETDEPVSVSLIEDMEEEIDDFYTIQYYDYILGRRKVTYNDREVVILRDAKLHPYVSKHAVIRYVDDTTEFTVDVRDLHFHYPKQTIQ